jgi:PH (Pleckstrin Homology) domain-containing protein
LAIFGVTFIYRIDSMKVVADESGLLIRNLLRTSRFPWGEVEGFRPGRSMMAMPFGQVIHVLLRNGEVVTADVTARPWILFGGRARLERTLQDLRRWLPRQAS